MTAFSLVLSSDSSMFCVQRNMFIKHILMAALFDRNLLYSILCSLYSVLSTLYISMLCHVLSPSSPPLLLLLSSSPLPSLFVLSSPLLLASFTFFSCFFSLLSSLSSSIFSGFLSYFSLVSVFCFYFFPSLFVFSALFSPLCLLSVFFPLSVLSRWASTL